MNRPFVFESIVAGLGRQYQPCSRTYEDQTTNRGSQHLQTVHIKIPSPAWQQIWKPLFIHPKAHNFTRRRLLRALGWGQLVSYNSYVGPWCIVTLSFREVSRYNSVERKIIWLTILLEGVLLRALGFGQLVCHNSYVGPWRIWPYLFEKYPDTIRFKYPESKFVSHSVAV